MQYKQLPLISLSLITLLCCDFSPVGWTAGDTASESDSSAVSTTSSLTTDTDTSETSAAGSATSAESDATTSSSGDSSLTDSDPTEGSTTQGSTTFDDSTNTDDTTTPETGDTEDTETGNTEETSETTGNSMFCDGDPPVLDYKCDTQSEDTLFVEVPGETVAPNSTIDFDLPISECGDGTRAAAGFVARVRMKDACLWSMRMSLVCPTGSELELTRPDGCSVNCEQVPGEFDAIFRTSSNPSCHSCDFMLGFCYRQASGELEKNICNFLDECIENSSEPWKLRVEAGDSEVQVESIALTMALRSM